MGRIFLSYSEKDRDYAKRVARLLELAGFEVAWQRQDSAGQDWSSVLQQALRGSDCLVVLWSQNSVGSDSVKEEAAEGRTSGKLMPVLIDQVQPLVGFGNLQAADLSDWDGSFDAVQFQMLVSALKSRTEQSMASAPAPRAAGASKGGIFSKVTGTLGKVMKRLRTGVERPTSPSPSPPKRANGGSPPVAAGSQEGEVEAAEPVLLGIGAPRQAAPGSSFSARFVAYVAAAKELAESHLKDLGDPGDRIVTDVSPDREARWRVGAPITVRLTGEHLRFTPAERSFEWNGRENLVSFAVTVDADAPRTKLQLCFHVLLDALEIAFIPVGLTVGDDAAASEPQETTAYAPSSAFASYSSKDAELVTRSLSTLAHWAPTLDIFQDCLDLTPNEAFKAQLEAQIGKRDVFLLFWSRHARDSKWVLWEFETACLKPGMDAILPMPLED
ncbi:MAG: toll/interleukin-1 receptor domain-containing protein, partial [Candidatus Binatia bacterium]